jgi:hypothetical protein
MLEVIDSRRLEAEDVLVMQLVEHLSNYHRQVLPGGDHPSAAPGLERQVTQITAESGSVNREGVNHSVISQGPVSHIAPTNWRLPGSEGAEPAGQANGKVGVYAITDNDYDST